LPYRRLMRSFERLDAWESCHALTVGVLETTGDLVEQDPDLIGQLQRSALLCSSRLARGAGTGNQKMFRACAEQSLGFLSEVGYLLTVADLTGVIPSDVRDRLDALRGRAAFYTARLVFEAIDPPRLEEDLGEGPADGAR
jgi:four helix bundle protein